MKAILKTSLITLLISLSFNSFAEEINPDNNTKQITVSGESEKDITFSVEDLKKLKLTEINNFKIITKSGKVKGKENNYIGILLKDLINHNNLKIKDLKELNHTVIIIEASDNYKVVFSWNEIFNTNIGKKVLIAYEKNDKNIDNSEGPILLISAGDYLTWARHVKWLKTITIKKL